MYSAPDVQAIEFSALVLRFSGLPETLGSGKSELSLVEGSHLLLCAPNPYARTLLRLFRVSPRVVPRKPVSGCVSPGPLDRYRVHGARCTHLNSCMPYRDPTRRAAWMREYRKRKRGRRISSPSSFPSPRSIALAPEPSYSERILKSGPQSARTNSGFVRQGEVSSFKNALELARTFPPGLLASQVCPYCNNTGYSSPGTRCSYCRRGER
jgi:hypothetical protein